MHRMIERKSYRKTSKLEHTRMRVRDAQARYRERHAERISEARKVASILTRESGRDIERLGELLVELLTADELHQLRKTLAINSPR
jgi:hypothetical protein